MIEKQEAREIFDTSDIQAFTFSTPKKNLVQGWICQKHNDRMGSILITDINEEVIPNYYITSMPKLQYFNPKYHKFMGLPDIYNKLDGTCIVVFPLIKDGEIIEVLYKTRGMPYPKKQWAKKIERVAPDGIEEMVLDTGNSFSFELYGVGNKHKTQYLEWDLSLRMDLLSGHKGGYFLPCKETEKIGKKYDIPMVFKNFNLSEEQGQYIAEPTEMFIERYSKYLPEETTITTNSLSEMWRIMENEYYEQMNMKYQKESKLKGLLIEGSIWYGMDEEEITRAYKVKPLSVKENAIKVACGIPRDDFIQAIQKADENLPFILEKKNQKDVFEYVLKEFEEDYDKEMIEDHRVKQKFQSIYARYIRKVEIEAGDMAVAKAVIEEAGEGLSAQDYMREFSQMYPEKRRRTGKIFNAIEECIMRKKEGSE